VEKNGRQAFRCAAPGARREQSTQEFFRRRPGNASMHSGGSGDDVFCTPREPVMSRALGRSLFAAASSSGRGGGWNKHGGR